MLVADEDPERRLGVADLLGAGATVSWCGNGAEALWQAGRSDAAVVILSATLPGVSAAEVATVIAEHRSSPGAIAVAVGAGETELAGPVLAAGANSVVSRPYRARELNALLISYGARPGEADGQAVLRVGSLHLDLPAFEASASGRRLRLTLREFELLPLLMLHAGDVVTHQYIREQSGDCAARLRAQTRSPCTFVGCADTSPERRTSSPCAAWDTGSCRTRSCRPGAGSASYPVRHSGAASSSASGPHAACG